MRLLGHEASGPLGLLSRENGASEEGGVTAANNIPLHGRVIGMTPLPTPLGLRDEEATRMGPPVVAMGADNKGKEGRPHEKQGMGLGMWEA